MCANRLYEKKQKKNTEYFLALVLALGEGFWGLPRL